MNNISDKRTLAKAGAFSVRIAQSKAEIEETQRLRYTVFVEEMGANASREAHEKRMEHDSFDPICEHIIVIHEERNEIIACTRVTPWIYPETSTPHFYSWNEFDLTPIIALKKPSIEIGRTCIDMHWRGRALLQFLWIGLAQYTIQRNISFLFGCASLSGTDPEPFSHALSFLWNNYLAPAEIRIRPLDAYALSMNRIPKAEISREKALQTIPPLLKNYLRLGGKVSDGAWIDHAFNTIDVFLIVDMATIPPETKRRFLEGAEKYLDRLAH